VKKIFFLKTNPISKIYNLKVNNIVKIPHDQDTKTFLINVITN